MNRNAQDSEDSEENEEVKDLPIRMNSLRQINTPKIAQKSKSGVFKSNSVSEAPSARKPVSNTR
jgi:hypothetical protein